MTSAIPLGLAAATLVALYVLLRAMASTYFKLRGTRIVTCPETKTTVAVELDAGRAALHRRPARARAARGELPRASPA